MAAAATAAAASQALLSPSRMRVKQDEDAVIEEVDASAAALEERLAQMQHLSAEATSTGASINPHIGRRRPGGGGGGHFAVDMSNVDFQPSSHSGALASAAAAAAADMEERRRLIDEDEDDSDDDELNRMSDNAGESTPEILRREFQRVRHALGQNRSIQAVAYMFSAFLPFALLFLFKLCFEKRNALTTSLLGYMLFIFGDKHVTSLVSTMRGSIALPLCAIVGHYAALYYIFDMEMDAIVDGLTFQFPAYESAMATIYFILMADLAAKHATLLAKLALISLPEKTMHAKRRRRLYQLVEYASQLYRSAIAAPRWIMFFLGPAQLATAAASIEQLTENAQPVVQLRTPVVDLVLVTLYICLKLRESLHYSLNVYRSLMSLLHIVSYGVLPTQEELAREPKCSICIDTMKCPIKLSCNHIFCEECAETWLDEKHTCPMCRAQVQQQDSAWFNGSTCKTIRFY